MKILEILGMWVRRGLKNQWGQGGRGVKTDNKTKGLITWARLALFAKISATWLTATKTQLCNYMTTEPARLAGIAVLETLRYTVSM